MVIKHTRLSLYYTCKLGSFQINIMKYNLSILYWHTKRMWLEYAVRTHHVMSFLSNVLNNLSCGTYVCQAGLILNHQRMNGCEKLIMFKMQLIGHISIYNVSVSLCFNHNNLWSSLTPETGSYRKKTYDNCRVVVTER